MYSRTLPCRVRLSVVIPNPRPRTRPEEACLLEDDRLSKSATRAKHGRPERRDIERQARDGFPSGADCPAARDRHCAYD